MESEGLRLLRVQVRPRRILFGEEPLTQRRFSQESGFGGRENGYQNMLPRRKFKRLYGFKRSVSSDHGLDGSEHDVRIRHPSLGPNLSPSRPA
jgi:hypothetical protein